ncbi:MAG: hypothetical protein FJW31_07035 [Acidobacteria bacterium]|nr:hypothetical protein [Acidobacteriota bacterium]
MKPPPPLERGHPQLAEFVGEVLQMCLAYWQGVGERPVWSPPEARALDQALRKPITERPTAPDAVLELLRSKVLTTQAHLAHPRFFGFVPSAGNFVSALADLIASVHNPFAGSWLEGAGAQTVERTVIEWLAREAALPFGARGLFLSGGSISNLTAIMAARKAKFKNASWSRGAIYFSDQTMCR